MTCKRGGLAKILNATIIDTTEGQTDDYEDQIPFETLREVATEIDWDVGIENNLNCVVSVPNVDFIDGGYGGSYEESWVSFATNAGGYIDGYYADICPYFIYFENGSLVISQASVPVFDSVDEDGLVDYRCDIIGIVRQKPNDTMPSPYDFYIENVYMYQVEGNSYEPSAWYEARSNGGDTYDEDGLTESDYVMLDRIFGGQYGDYTNAWWRRDPETYTFADMMAAFEDTYSEDTLCNLYAFLIEDCLLGK